MPQDEVTAPKDNLHIPFVFFEKVKDVSNFPLKSSNTNKMFLWLFRILAEEVDKKEAIKTDLKDGNLS